MSKPIVNVDLDGVVYPFIEVFTEYLEEEMGENPPLPEGFKTPTKWEVWEDWGMTQSEWTSWFRTAVRDYVVWHNGQPITGAVHGLWDLSDAGYHIRIATNRLVLATDYQLAVTATVAWLDRNNVPYHSLAMLGGESKATLTGVTLLDDKPENVREWRWAQAMLFNQPWNRERVDSSDLFTVYGWENAVATIREEVGL